MYWDHGDADTTINILGSWPLVIGCVSHVGCQIYGDIATFIPRD